MTETLYSPRNDPQIDPEMIPISLKMQNIN